MTPPLDPRLRRALAERIRYYREMGIFDFYRRSDFNQSEVPAMAETAASADSAAVSVSSQSAPEQREQMTPRTRVPAVVPVVEEDMFAPPKPEAAAPDPARALEIIRADLGDCTRCRLHKQGRKQIVFGVGNPRARLMFIGEAPGADEDQQGEPFVGRAGQLLNNMIQAMGLRREDVYIANIIKCRPPNNRTPERDECDTCSPFLMRQIAVIQPQVIVALGAVAAKTLLAINASMAELRGRWYDFRGTKLAVTYHPAFLLRDPRQKKEAWKDLQMVMKDLGLKAPARGVE
jgi:uracil-DNA glycosylase